MTQRIDTTDMASTGDVFSPAGDFTVQVDMNGSAGYVDIEAQADTTAPFVAIGTLSRLDNPPIRRFARCPFVRLRLYNNDGKTVRAWSGE